MIIHKKKRANSLFLLLLLCKRTKFVELLRSGRPTEQTWLLKDVCSSASDIPNTLVELPQIPSPCARRFSRGSWTLGWWLAPAFSIRLSLRPETEATSATTGILSKTYVLVGGWTNPFEKYESKWESTSPGIGVKIKKTWWNHHHSFKSANCTLNNPFFNGWLEQLDDEPNL